VADQMVAGHENRIQRLEEGVPDLSAKVATCLSQIEHTREHLGDKIGVVSGNVDAVLKEMRQHASDSTRRFEKVFECLEEQKESIGSQNLRVSSLESHTQVGKERWKGFKKFGLALVLTGLGAVAAKFGQQLYAWLA